MPRSLLLAAAALAVPLLGACGDDTEVASSSTAGTPAIEHPAGPTDTVVRLAFEGGFVPVGVAFANLPSVLITGDGTVHTAAPVPEIYPGPLMSTFNTRPLTEDGLQAVLRRATDLGLLAPPGDLTADLDIVDVPDTVVTITADGSTFEHRAYALGMGDPNSEGTELTPARQDLLDFVEALVDLPPLVGEEALGPEQTLVPAAVRLQATPIDPAMAGDSEVKPTLVGWPADADVALSAAAECAITASPAAVALLVEARQTTLFTAGDLTYTVVAAPVLPGDPGC